MLYCRISLLSAIFILACSILVLGQTKYKALIMDGQNDHKNWQQTTQLMKKYLEETGLFTVDVATNTPSEGGTLDSFKPNFSKYNVIVSNYNGDAWPQNINKGFQDFVNNGGGLLIIHAANNAFPQWLAYNQMIGVGGGRGRNEKSGPFVYYDEEKSEFVYDTSPFPAGYHGAEHPFRVKIRNQNHPITKGLPSIWMHETDGLYNQLRGPAKNMEVLATAFSAKNQKGSGKHEPVMMVINYGSGRIFHTTLGHGSDSQKGVGFVTILQRGAEWAASGKVTQKVPADFPGPNRGSKRP